MSAAGPSSHIQRPILYHLPALLLALTTFFIPIKPAPANLFLVLTLFSVFLTTTHRSQLQKTLLSAVGLASLGFFAMLVMSQLYSNSTWADAGDYLSKYARLAYIPFLAAAVLNRHHVIWVLASFSAGMLLTLLLSFSIVIHPESCDLLMLRGCGPQSNPTVFKLHITQNYFMALAAALWAYFFLLLQARPQTRTWSLVALVFAALALMNVLFMVDGRTGWVVVGVLLSYLFYQRFGLKGALAGAIVTVFLLVLALVLVPALQQIFGAALQEFHTWMKHGVAEGRSGMRLTYYTHAVQAIAEKPLFGHGLGGVRHALNLAALNDPNFALNNPHNQYLLFGVQIGLLGLAMYLAYLGFLFRASMQLPVGRNLPTAFLLTFAVGNLFNSFHFDMSEAMLFMVSTALVCSGCAGSLKGATRV
ncbi:O-antigen ligase family protein [Limnobacter sp.]|uniref:O-antigen ligase family protein n=1 Tax=Limnobacter sp. TaxID=2003368 RepID=UPI0035122533